MRDKRYIYSIFPIYYQCCLDICFIWDMKLTAFSPNAEKYGPEKTPYLDTFHAVNELVQMFNVQIQTLKKHIFFKREQNKFYNHPKEHS